VCDCTYAKHEVPQISTRTEEDKRQMHLVHKKGKIYLDQTDYLKKVLQRFRITNARFAAMPLPAGYRPLENTLPADTKLCQQYQSVIGSLLYIMLGTRPDIAYAVTKMSQFAVNPSHKHLDKVLYIVAI